MTRAGLFLSALALVVAVVLIAADACGAERDPRNDGPDPGELVCDPFAGSGTTGAACIRLGRRFIGWEKDPKYFAVAVKRLRQAREQLRLFEGGAALDRVEG